MNRLFYLSIACLLTLCVSSCKTSKTSIASYGDLAGEWNVIEMNGKKLNPQETKQYFAFDTDGNTISGNAGCNRISGRIDYTLEQKNIIRFSQMVSTRMACLDNMSLEDELLKTVDKVVRFEPVGNVSPVKTVALYGADNSKLFVIEKR